MDTSKLKAQNNKNSIEFDTDNNIFIKNNEVEAPKDNARRVRSTHKRNKKIKLPLYLVTERQFKTRKKTYKISKIEKTEIRRNLMFFFPISVLSLMFTYKFWDYLYTNEIIVIISLAIILGLSSLLFGTLYVYSKALGEPALLIWVESVYENAAIDPPCEELNP